MVPRSCKFPKGFRVLPMHNTLGAGKRVLGVLLESYAMRAIANSVNLIGRPYRFCTNS